MAEEIPHCRLVKIAGEERVRVGRRTPERDQIAVRPIKEAKTSDESGCHRQPLEELGRSKPELGGPLPINKSPLQDKHRTRRFGSEISVGPLLCGEYGRDRPDAFDGCHLALASAGGGSVSSSSIVPSKNDPTLVGLIQIL